VQKPIDHRPMSDPLIIRNVKNQKISAKITKIDNKGRVTIKFDTNMNQIANYTSLDSKALELRIIDKRKEVH
jgi:hypothetical protein